jgi:hypothetical protein
MIVRRVLGAAVGFETSSPEIETELVRLTRNLPALAADRRTDVRYTVEPRASGAALVRDGVLVREFGRDEILVGIVQDLTAHWVRRDDVALIHAGVVVREGGALVLAGCSGRGKSTMTAGLLGRGFAYSSDELAPVTADLRVLRYPLPLRLRDGGLAGLGDLRVVLEVWRRPVRVAGERRHFASPRPELVAPDASVPVKMIVFPVEPDRSEARVSRVARGTAAIKIMAETLNYAALGQAGFDRAIALATAVPCCMVALDGVRRTLDRIEQIWSDP